jgi:ABC-type uncharacterized transport system substrate-binding protein
MGNLSDDPIQHGLIASLARPGGNITGLIDMLPDLAGKRLELLKETFPKLTRVAHLSAQGAAPGLAHLKEVETTGRALGIRVQGVEVPAPDGLENAFRAVAEGRAEAIIVVGSIFSFRTRSESLPCSSSTVSPECIPTPRGNRPADS